MDPDTDQTHFFSVTHIIESDNVKLIYGIHFEGLDYFLCKTHGVADCEQMDNNPKLDPDIFCTMCDVITEIELEYKKTPPMEFINMEVYNILVRAKNPRYGDYVIGVHE